VLLPESGRQPYIANCGDLRALESWVRRAATADSIEDVIDAL
jgi:hypothetical protein